MISKAEPHLWQHLSHKVQDCVGEVFLRWIVPIMGDVAVHDGPEPLDGIEMRAIGRPGALAAQEGSHDGTRRRAVRSA